MIPEIKCYADFLQALRQAGFTMGGSNSEGIYNLISWDWKQEPPYPTPVRWHTEDPETDPWEWRIRVLDEKQDIAYGKLFFNKSGYITKAWYPYFLAARGRIAPYGGFSPECDRIYELIADNGALPLHVIKLLGGFGKEEKAAFEKAMLFLQRRLYITMCGKEQKRTKLGDAYGWSSMTFCTTEAFWGKEVFERAVNISKPEAVDHITRQIRKLNPNAVEKKLIKFIEG